MSYNIVTKNTVRDRFKAAPRPAFWKDVEEKDWNNWIWQQQKRIKSMDVLEKVIQVTQEEHDAFAKSHEMFNMAITPYYAALIDPVDHNCPIRLQSVPKLGELTILEKYGAESLDGFKGWLADYCLKNNLKEDAR